MTGTVVDAPTPAPGAKPRRQRMLVRQIRYTEVRRPLYRGAAMAVLLVPALHLGLDTTADRLLVAVVGVVCSGTLLYSASKFRALKREASQKEVGRSARVLTGVAAFLAVVGGVASVLAGFEVAGALWMSVGALCLAAALSLVAVTRIPRGWRVPGPTARSLEKKREVEEIRPFVGTAIACSGGGIRSAAFCLGGLQRLRWVSDGGEASFYDGAKRVFAVSGGGYVATALHLARRHSDTAVHAELFAPGSEEEEWLRRRSKYLLPSGARVAGALSLLYGIAWSLSLVIITVYVAAWYVGWLLTRVGGVCGVNGNSITAAGCLTTAGPATWDPTQWWQRLMVGLLVSGLVLFAALKTISKFWPRGGVPAAITRVLVAAGVAAATVGLLVPWLIVNLSNAALNNNPTETVAKGIAASQLATPEACEAAIKESLTTQAEIAWDTSADTSKEVSFTYGACGDTWTDDSRAFAPNGSAIALKSPWCPDTDGARTNSQPVPSYCADQAKGGLSGWESVAAWLAVVSASIAAIRGLAKGLSGSTSGSTGSEKTSKPSRLATFAESLRHTVLPWTAVVVLGFVVAIVLLDLIRDNLVNPDGLNSIPGPVWAAVVFLVLRFLSDAILSSLHPYYRERLSATFLIRRDADGLAQPLDYKNPTHLWVDPPHEDGEEQQAQEPPEQQAQQPPKQPAQQPAVGQPAKTAEPLSDTLPQLTICCAVNISDQDYVPAARGCAPFLFHTGQFVPPPREGGPDQLGPHTKEVSDLLAPLGAGAIGISDARLPQGRVQPAETFSASSDPQGFDTTLAAAMATSAAAFSPLVGRKSGQVRPYRVLLALVNARLGVWLPNPYTVKENGRVAQQGPAQSGGTWWKWASMRARRPGPYRLFKEAFGALSIYDGRLYVTDGGHYDNTGLVEALRDRPQRLVVLDASADPRDSLDALGDAIVTARMDLGLVIKPFDDKDDLVSLRGTVNKKGKYVPPKRGWMHLKVATVENPDVNVCHIWFVKNVLAGDPDLELGTYAAEHPSFPSTSTSNQFYGEYDFEAYRLLGFTNTTAMMDAMKEFETKRAQPVTPPSGGPVGQGGAGPPGGGGSPLPEEASGDDGAPPTGHVSAV